MLLDLIWTSNLTDNEFLDGQYKSNRANFVNDSAARCVASFGRELPTLFGRVEPSLSDVQLASTHPLFSINNYTHFNAADNLSGIKQRILSKINTIISRINAGIGQCLSGNVVANSVALNFLLKSQEAVLSLVSWIENFQQELSSAGQSSPKEAWLLVCSCVQGFFQQLEKVRAPAAAFSDESAVQTSAYRWAMAQSHRVRQEFMSAQWCSHYSIVRIINYHVFKFMVPLSSHLVLKEEITSLRKTDKDRQVELSKLVTRLVKLEQEK